jgi:prophage antirepressor-like protein
MNELQIFQFEEGREIRTVERNGEPWFVAKDVCDVLGIEQPTRSVENFPESEVLKVSSSEVSNTERDSRGGASTYLLVNEPGLYRLIFQSRKPEAERFKTWMFTEVLPAIRKTGGYLPKRELDRLIEAKLAGALEALRPPRPTGPSRQDVKAFKDVSDTLNIMKKWDGKWIVQKADYDKAIYLLMDAKSRLVDID